MLIRSNKKLAKISELCTSIFNCSLYNVDNLKYLGINLTSDFIWSDHVEYDISKINQGLGLLRRIKHVLPFQTRLLFYYNVVLPMLDYADLVWGKMTRITLL